MALFTKTIETPRDMDNIYKEFEGFFTSSIREVEVEWNEDHTSKHNDFDDIVEKKLLENYFQEIIERIKLHLLEQLSKYNQIQIISFIEKQNINIKSFEPEKRKRELYNLYLLENIAFGDDSILKSNYQLREYERLIVTHAYQKYSDAYKSLGIEMEKLFSSFNKVINDTSDHLNNEERTKLTRLTSVVSLEEQNASIQNLFGKLKKKSYKKHIEGLDFMRIPNEILKTYLVRCEYEYLEISGFGKIPVHKFPLLAAEDRNLVVPEHCFKAYAEGFIEGYNNSLVPFVDTPESRKEKIIIEAIGKGGKGFTEHHGDDVDLYLPEDFYNLGIFEGKRYKAWSYILDTPLQFIEYFKQDQREAVLQKKLPEKWYALYHMILIANGKQVPNLSSGSKVEIIKYGKEHYGTNQGFYRVLKEIDLNKMTAYIRSLPNKDRHQWKQIIIELSDKDADVMAWLNKQPN